MAVLVTANSVDKLDNLAFGAGAGVPVAIAGERGQLTLDAPLLDLPPYEARLGALDEDGIRSSVTTVPVAGSKRACADPAIAVCIAAAETLLRSCQEGRAPRERCHPKVWRTRPAR